MAIRRPSPVYLDRCRAEETWRNMPNKNGEFSFQEIVMFGPPRMQGKSSENLVTRITYSGFDRLVGDACQYVIVKTLFTCLGC